MRQLCVNTVASLLSYYSFRLFFFSEEMYNFSASGHLSNNRNRGDFSYQYVSYTLPTLVKGSGGLEPISEESQELEEFHEVQESQESVDDFQDLLDRLYGVDREDDQ